MIKKIGTWIFGTCNAWQAIFWNARCYFLSSATYRELNATLQMMTIILCWTPHEWTPDITRQVIKCDNKMCGGEKCHDRQTIQNI